MIKLNLQFYGEKIYVDATDKNGKKVEGAYSIDGKTYKADGSRIDAGTSVVTAGGTFTYNGDGTSSKTSNKTSSSGGGGGGSKSTDIGTLMNDAYKSGDYEKVLELAKQRSEKIDNDSSLEPYRDQYNGIIEASKLALQKQPKEPTNGGATASSGFNDLVNQYAKNLKEQNISNLNKSYNSVLSQISRSEQNAKDVAKSSENKASVQNQLKAMQMNRMLNNLGIANSGTSAQMNMNNAGVLQNAMTTIESDKARQLAELQNQRNEAKTNLEYDINSLNAGIDAQALASQMNYLQQKELTQQDYENQSKLLQQQLEYNNIWDDSVGRYVPFSYYATSHNIGGASYGGGGTTISSNSQEIDAKTLTDLQKQHASDEYNNDMPFVEWVKKYRPQYYQAVINSGYYDTDTRGTANNVIDYNDLPDKTKNLAKINEAILNKELTYDYLMSNEGFNFLIQAGLTADEINEELNFARYYSPIKV